MPAISQPLPLSRALRPLRTTVPSLTRERLDETATAQRIAETGVFETVMVPAQERRHDLALVVDVGPSMVVWRQTVDELRLLLQQLGAFRDMRTWYLDTGAHRLSLRTGSAFGVGAERDPDELVDPTPSAPHPGRQRLHRRGLAGRPVRRAARPVGPRQHRRDRPAPAAAAVVADRGGDRAGPVRRVGSSGGQRTAHRHAGGAATARLPAAGHRDPGGRAERALAAVVGGPGGARRPERDGAALFTGKPMAHPPPAEPDAVSAEMRVKQFRAASSPAAFKLATFLAAAPLRLPVMRLVQQAMLPTSTSADLAEVFLSGLLRMAVRPSGGGEEEIAYEFHDGVREILLQGLRRREVHQVLRAVWGVVRERIGSSLDFPALLAAVSRGKTTAARPAFRAGRGAGAGRPRRALPPDGETADQRRARARAVPDADIADGDVNRATMREATASDEPAPLPRRWLPGRNPDFVGRDRLLTEVRAALREGAAALLPHSEFGLGGEGKSISRSSTPIATPTITTWCGGFRPSRRRRSAQRSPCWHGSSACR